MPRPITLRYGTSSRRGRLYCCRVDPYRRQLARPRLQLHAAEFHRTAPPHQACDRLPADGVVRPRSRRGTAYRRVRPLGGRIYRARRDRRQPGASLLDSLCFEHPDEWGCQRRQQRVVALGPSSDPPATVWLHDERTKAAIAAAPAAGYAFTAGGLAGVKTPVRLWEAEDDRRAPNRWNGDVVKANLPSPPEAHPVQTADHFAFLAPCGEALAARVPEICREPPGFDRTAFHHDPKRRLSRFSASNWGLLPRSAAAARSYTIGDRGKSWCATI